jgi:hypothetical protein
MSKLNGPNIFVSKRAYSSNQNAVLMDLCYDLFAAYGHPINESH